MPRLLKTIWGAIILTATFLWIGTAPVYALTVETHTFACTECHKSTLDPRPLTNFCIGCHSPGGGTVGGVPIAPVETFVVGDASNAGGRNAAAAEQSSHYWGGTTSIDAAAGSKNPPTTFYPYGNVVSTGKITCTICHDPHKGTVTPYKQLRATTADDVLCKQCHVPFYQDFPYANLTHPVGPLVKLGADPLLFNSSVVNSNSGDVRLITGPLGIDYVSCTSCHGTHFTDSNSMTPDGAANAAGMATGDGFLLRTDGPLAATGTPQEIADKRSAVCTACHPYKTHGNDTEPVGCLVCHSAHVYNGTLPPNNFVLRNSATTTAFGTVTGMTYTAAPPVTAGAVWADTGATANGYCEKCHGNLLDTAVGKISAMRQHTEGENCRTCHVHKKAGALRSFEATGCDGCHADPPGSDVPTLGYAVDIAKGYNYKTTSGVWKDESLTPHTSHAGNTSGYNFACSLCHNDNFATTHDQGSFQDVLAATGTFSTLVKPVGSGLSPVYTKTGTGSCTSVACHSNGGKRTGNDTRTYKASAPAPVWAGGKDDIAIGTCDVCHGNSAATMIASARDNSVSHDLHLKKGYSCNVCHKDTATSATALVANAESVKHINGLPDVAFAAGGTYVSASGTCTVTCHGTSTPDWDLNTTGACGACHQYSTDVTFIATGTGTALSAAHNKHVYAAAGGVQLACTICHTNAGAPGVANTDHVNGLYSMVTNYQTAVCNPCHGATNGVVTGDDRQPIWTSTASVDCQTCHAGSSLASVNAKPASNKTLATSVGHGKTTGSYASDPGNPNPAANKACSACHDSAATGHFDAITGDDSRLLASAATCTTSCHGGAGGGTATLTKGLVTHQAANCNVCHDPHGSSNIFMINTTSTSYNGTVAFTALLGDNSYDEDDGADGGVTENNADDLCATCHTSALTLHNNKQNTDNKGAIGHKLGEDCFTCHKPHTDATKPFGVGVGTACNDCHGFPPATGAHRNGSLLTDDQLHSSSLLSDDTEDRTDCAICHLGANLYSYDLSLDQGSADPDQNNHGVSLANRQAVLTASVGYNATDKNCTAACHASTLADGAWNDEALNCNACHANPPADGPHSLHIAAALVCADCHGTVDAAGAALIHTHAKDIGAPGTNDAEKVQSRGKDYINPTGLDITVDDAPFNGAGGSTWLNSSNLVDPGNTCSNIYCHDPSNNGSRADWDDDNTTCTLCHGDDQVGTTISTGSHTVHLNADTKFGVTIDCNRCHLDNTGNNDHFIGAVGANTLAKLNKSVKFNGTVITNQYLGEVNLPSTGVGTCSVNTCHNNGKGVAAITSFTWGTPVATDCQFCHDDPPASGRHGAHLGTSVLYGPYKGVASTTCGDCHTANNDLTMTGQTAHMDGAINFVGGTSVASGGIVANATVTACNNCHGALVASANANAALAKAQWNTAARLSCESCHGDFTLANSKADVSGVIAPSRAGTAYDTKGHGMATTPAAAKNGAKPVAKACSACHDSAASHISGVIDGVNRLQSLSGKTYGVLAESNDWCSGCHTSTPAMFGHFANTQTVGNTSDDGLYCSTCHDPHGQSGQDSMVAGTIQGNTVTGFADRTLRESYGNATYTGVCQVCHDSAEVPHFNRSSFGDDGSGSHQSGNCLTCHKVTDSPKFQASGCNGCHGGGYGVFPLDNNFWPDSSNARAENTAGRHAKHMQRLALSRYNETLDQLLTDNANGSADVKQLALCAYCHNTPGLDGDHGLTLPAEVNSMYTLWGGATPTLDNGTWAAGTNLGNCSNLNCHNNMTTPAGFGWYGPNPSACTMCHLAGGVDNTLNGIIHPNTGLHKVVNTSTVQAHNHTMVAPGASGCAACHDTVQPASHINGVAVDDSSTNDDRFLLATSFTYVDGAVGQPTCSGTSTLLVTCHTDGGNWGRLWSKDADSTSTVFGSTRCNVCHGQSPGGSSLGWRTGMTVNHNLTNINDVSKHNNCEYCHVAPSGPYATYVYSTHHENDLVETNNGAGVGYDAVDGSCLNYCHPGGFKKTMGGSTLWANNPLAGPSPTCGECHDPTGGALLEPYATTTGHGGGAHAKHLETTASNYADTGNNSAAATYSYGCANCHPNTIAKHFNGTIDMTLDSTDGGPLKSLNNVATDPLTLGVWDFTGGTAPTYGGFVASGSKATRHLTCTAAYCHSDGKGTFNTTPDWYGGAYAGPDPCAYCHLNSPDGTSHRPHNVGIHYNNVYTGTAGVVKDASLRQNAHGDAATSTTISCQICHYDTVTVKVNANNTVCITCHSDTNTPLTGNEAASIASKAMHVNGLVDVKFQNIPVLSRAQLRNPLAAAPEVNDNWKRQNGYKVDATSHDETWDTQVTNLTRPLDTATMYDPASKNCTVACHNNNDIGWGATTISCSNCHSELPQ